jgi:hypothetical protein
MCNTIVFTLFEKHYAYGVGALLNSLVASQFKGLFVVGYMGNLPFWTSQLIKKDNYYYISNLDHIRIEFLKIETDLHLRYYKPFLFENLMTNNKADYVYYFDPDITIIGDWCFFEEWASYGTALVLDDCYAVMPYNHPLKQQWAKIFEYNSKISKEFNYYVNSGFIGGNASSLNLIQQWKQNILDLKTKGHNLNQFKPAIIKSKTHKRLNPITGDQDILNASICQIYNEVNLSIIGPEGMGFTPAGYVMQHNTGSKSWNKSFLIDFIQNGVKISEANYAYFKYSSSPINLYPSLIKKLLIKIDMLLTRVLQRIF